LKHKSDGEDNMKHKFVLWLLGLLLFSTALYPGDVDRVGQPIMVYENGFTPVGGNFWASGGAGIANPNNAEALFYNPAWSSRSKYTVLIGGLRQFEKRFFLIEDLGVSIGGKWLLPSYSLLARRFELGLLFLGYQNIYDFKKKFEVEIATPEHPEGTGEFMTNIEEETLQNFFVGFNRALISHVNIGIKAGLLRHHFSGEIGQRTIDSKVGYSYALELGLVGAVGDRGQVALTYRYFDPLKYTFKMSAPRFSNNADSIEWISTEIDRQFRLPWLLDLGVYFRPLRYLRVMLKLEYQEWKKVSRYYEDRLQWAFGATVVPDERWRLNFGAFSSGRYPEKKDGIEDTPFVTAGINYRIKPRLMLSASALSNTFFVKKMNDNAEQMERSQVLFGLQWMFE